VVGAADNLTSIGGDDVARAARKVVGGAERFPPGRAWCSFSWGRRWCILDVVRMAHQEREPVGSSLARVPCRRHPPSGRPRSACR
jgi:hypothetical protein